MRKYVLAGALLCATTVAPASAPGEWDKLNQRVNRACVAMSGLSRPQLLAQKISFSDTIGVEVRQLRGADKRGRMSYLLCAYDRRTGRTEVQPAGGWLGATVRP